MNITRILCPTDFSPCSRQAWLRAVGIAKAQGAAITVLHVVPPVAPGDGAGDHQRLLRMLDEFVSIDKDGLSIETVILEAPAAHEEIILQADRLRADLIVMGTHGRSGLDRLLLGSVAERVLRTARQSVMTVGLPADGVPHCDARLYPDRVWDRLLRVFVAWPRVCADACERSGRARHGRQRARMDACRLRPSDRDA